MKKYFDTIHGFVAEATSKQMAWMLIRNKCHELKKEFPDNALHIGYGQKDSDDSDRGCDSSKSNFSRARNGSVMPALPHLFVTNNIFQHHNGIIDDDSDSKRESEKSKGIESKPCELHHHKSS